LVARNANDILRLAEEMKGRFRGEGVTGRGCNTVYKWVSRRASSCNIITAQRGVVIPQMRWQRAQFHKWALPLLLRRSDAVAFAALLRKGFRR
jgi:hypothetical protein